MSRARPAEARHFASNPLAGGSFAARASLVGSLAVVSRWVLGALGFLLLAHLPIRAADAPTRILDQQPFDRVTLDAAAGNETIDVQLLDLPNRKVPNPFPDSGFLELRRLSDPSVLYKLPWNSISKIELYEQLLLAEAENLTAARNMAQAFEYLNFLHKNYPQLEGLQPATEKYLRQDAIASYTKKNYEETLTILLALYDLNQQHPGLVRFVETVTDQLIAQELADRDFAAARSVLDMLKTGFARLQPSNVATWQAKFEKGATAQLTLARQAIDEAQYMKARQALRRAIAILPTVSGAEEMLAEIDRRSPLMIVGVDQLVDAEYPGNTLFWPAARVTQLTDPKLLDLVGFGAEGGDYECPWAKIASDDTGLKLDITLNSGALAQGISAAGLALELLRQADPGEPHFRADFAGLLDSVKINRGNEINIRWRRSHVRPEALLRVNLSRVTPATNPPGAYRQSLDPEDDQIALYELPQQDASPKNSQPQGPETIVEKFFDNEEAALGELIASEVDLLARIPPWQIDRLQKTDGIVVASYRLPTLHVLLPNYGNPIMSRREFRRALCYGIDRPQILNDILLGGQQRNGYRVLSAPLPAGVTLTDPVGYAYNQAQQPRTYEPRLAAVLATVARTSLAKQEALRKGAAGKPETEEAKADGEQSKEETKPAPVAPLVLAHPPNPVATAVCQSLKLQLGAVGIPIQLARLPDTIRGDMPDYDLRYAELAIWEPIVDARRLLGPHGLAGNCSSSMSLALRDVDQSKNWKEARLRLQEVHKIAFNDLPVIPLWQTVDFFAYRDSLSGVGTAPVTLYQNVDQWQRVRRGNR